MALLKKRKTLIIVGSVVVLLIVLRLLLPYFVLRYANRTLQDMDGYTGHVKDIDISLYRGAYQIDSIYIRKVDSTTGRQTPFFSAKKIDLSVEWASLFKGKIVGELALLSPELRFTKGRAEPGQVAKDTNDFRQVLRDFMPLQVNRFEVQDGRIRYLDSTAAPKVDISLTDTYIVANNLKNTSKSDVKLPSSVVASAKAYGGTFTLNMKLDALAKEPTFDLTAEIKQANLVKLNDFFIAYAKFDISRGTFSLYSEFAADQGRFKGYVKPIVKELEVKGVEDKKDGFLQKVKETVIDVVGDILENPKKDQIATKIPVQGSFGESSVGVWQAVWEVLKNAFIEALLPSIDNEIDISSPDGAKVGLERYKTSDDLKGK